MVSRLRGSLGFKGINGKAIKIVIKQRMNNNVISKSTSKELKRYIAAQMNKAGIKARNVARTKSHTPWLTGDLARSIQWERARTTILGNTIQGRLIADTPYARRQEFEHRTKGRFLFRAVIEIAQPEFLRLVGRRRPIEGIFVGGIGFPNTGG